MDAAQAPFWIGIIFFLGNATVLLAGILIPFLHGYSAIRVFAFTQSLELLLTPLYILAVETEFVLGFALLVLLNGVLDEVGKGVLPPVLKSIADKERIRRTVSLQRSSGMIARFVGIILAGLAYIYAAEYSYLIISATLAFAVLSSLLIGRNSVLVAEGQSPLSTVKDALRTFKEGTALTFTAPFVLDSLLDGSVLTLLPVLFLNVFKLSSTSYSLISASLYIMGSVGALILASKKLDRKKVIVFAFGSTSLLVGLYGLLQNLLGIIMVAALVGLIGSMGNTASSQVIYEDYPPSHIAITNQIRTFMIVGPTMLGTLAGGYLGSSLPAAQALLILSPFYALNTVLTVLIFWHAKRHSKVS